MQPKSSYSYLTTLENQKYEKLQNFTYLITEAKKFISDCRIQIPDEDFSYYYYLG